MSVDRVLVMTALPVERKAVVGCLQEAKSFMAEDGTAYTRGVIVIPGRRFDVWVATCDDAGNPASASQTAVSLDQVKPRYAFFVGVAGALRDATLGDVVFATQVEGYEAAAVRASRWEARPRVFYAPHSLAQAAKVVKEKNQWCDGLETSGRVPEVLLRPIASGEKVHKDSRANIIAFIRRHYNDSIAVDMEGRGFCEALRHDLKVMGAVIRGISDSLDDKDRLDPATCQATASLHAARFMVALLAELGRPGGGDEKSPSILRLPHHRNAYFRGRDDEMFRLYESLASGNPTVIVQIIRGEGGVGKTHLAVEYAYRRLSDYDIVLWLDAGDPAGLADAYAGLAECTEDLKHLAGRERPEVVKAVRQWLAGAGRWLLVFDNAEGPESVEHYIPPQGNGHVIVTSRNPNWGHLARTVCLDLWSRPESAAFLLDRTHSKDEASAAGVAELLGDLPLALEHAGAYVKATGCSLLDYARLLQSEGLGMLDDTAVQSHRAVSATWSITLKRLKKECPEAALLMCILAFLAPEGLPVSSLVGGAPVLIDSLNVSLSSVKETNRLVARLRRHGLAGRTGDKLSVHRVLQHAVRASLDASEARSAFAQAAGLLRRIVPGRPDLPENWDECADLVPHARFIGDHALQMDRGLGETVSVLSQTAVYLCAARAAYAEAEPLYRRALEISEKAPESEYPAIATALQDIAEILRADRRYGEAEPLFRRALEVGERSLGPEHPGLLVPRFNLWQLLIGTGQHEEAESLSSQMMQALGNFIESQDMPPQETELLLEKASQLEHANAAVVITNLVELFRNDLQDEEAEQLLRRALAIGEKFLGPEHRQVSHTLQQLALVLQDLGQQEEAEALLRRALEIGEKTLGPEHFEVAAALNNLAVLLCATQRHEEAEPLLRRALEIGEKTLGPEHPNVVAGRMNVAFLPFFAGQYEEAAPLLRDALEIGKKVLGPEHCAVADADLTLQLADLAKLPRDDAQPEEAEALYRRVLEIGEKALGPEHPEVAAALNNLAMLLHVTGRYEEAEPLFRRALEIREKDLEPEHPEVATSLNSLAVLLHKTGRNGEAEPLFRRALEMLERTLGPKHPDVAATLNHLAGVLAVTGRYEEAEPLVRRALEIAEEVLGPEHPNVAVWLNNLAWLLQTTGRRREARSLLRQHRRR
jgi:tetratricopeptide (TPR) repeat protein/nucleoside phosphorylase